MDISIIVAIGKESQIGLQGKIPWNSKEDLKYFKKKTMGHYIVMGRVTYQSLETPLGGRKIIVLSKTIKDIDGVMIAKDAGDAIEIAKNDGEDELFICGGEQVYKEFMPFTNKVYLTKINYSGNGDRFFDQIDQDRFRIVHEEQFADGAFLVLERCN